MSEHDEKLVDLARHSNWEDMYDLREQCESDEAYCMIYRMELSQYHQLND